MSSAISTKRSTIMAAALAFRSAELNTFDSIILFHSQHAQARRIISPRSRSNLLDIPPEILLLIRSHLLPILTAHILALSNDALSTYVQSVRALLCPECLAYNQEIFGPDIWQWAHFSGPCACAEVQAGISMRKFGIHPSFTPTFYRPTPKVNPKQFTDAEHWLEHHLSLEALRIRPSPPFGIRFTSDSRTRPAIWDLVSSVLSEFGCEVVRGYTSAMNHGRFMIIGSGSAHRNKSFSRWDYRGDRLLIAPLASMLSRCEQEKIGESGRNGDRWRTQIILGRLERELGLFSSEYEKDLDAEKVFKDTSSLRSTRMDRRTIPSSSRNGPFLTRCCSTDPLHDIAPSLIIVFNLVHWRTLTALLAACISLPLVLLTVSLTILCYYCRPCAFKIM